MMAPARRVPPRRSFSMRGLYTSFPLPPQRRHVSSGVQRRTVQLLAGRDLDDAGVREQLEGALRAVGEEREHHVDPEHLEELRQLAHKGLAQADPRAGLADDPQAEQALADGLVAEVFAEDRIQ